MMIRFSVRFALAGALAAGVAVPGAVEAQTSWNNVLSVAPLGAVFGVYNLEYERAFTNTATGGLSATYWGQSADGDFGSDADADYVSVDAKLRYYPGRALNGFSFGGLAGYTNIGGEVTECPIDGECSSDSGKIDALSLGVELDYSWLLGDAEKFFIGLGLGAKRLFLLDDDDDDLILAYPFGRLSVGIAF